jgi:hypothetical protein
MREWKHATTRIPCGRVSDCWIQPGELHCVFTQEDWLSAKYRCRQHAGCEPPADGEAQSADSTPPEDQPGKPLRVPEFSSVKHLSEVVSRDVKMAQAGDEDGK